MTPPHDPLVTPHSEPLHEYRLRVRPQRSEHGWRAELSDLSAPADAPSLSFETPLELARHLARDLPHDLPSPPPGAGLR